MLTFSDSLLLRVPLLPLRFDWTPDTLLAWAQDPVHQEALTLSSPSLSKALQTIADEPDSKASTNVLKTLYKYAVRMSSRCTPFGLFAGCTALSWQDNPASSCLVNGLRRRTRLDMAVITQLTEQINQNPVLLMYIGCFINPSLHTIGEEVSYIEYVREGDIWLNQISVTERTQPLAAVQQWMGNRSRQGMDIVHMLEKKLGYSKEDAFAYVLDLLEGQVLFPETTLQLTGQDGLQQLIRAISQIPAKKRSGQDATFLIRLEALRETLQRLDATSLQTCHKHLYTHVRDNLKALLETTPPEQIIQVDCEPLAEGGLPRDQQKALLEGINLLKYLVAPTSQPALTDFVSRFLERYEEREVPLLEVLDTEVGIGYGSDVVRNNSPLTADIAWSPGPVKQQTVSRQPVDQYLHGKWLESLREGVAEVQLQSEDLQPFQATIKPLPQSMSVIFRSVAGGYLLLESVSGASALQIMGRFTDYVPGIYDYAQQVAQQDANCYSEAILAEIVHLPDEVRAGNIVLRRGVHAYEIPILAQSNTSVDHTIRLDDLLISVRHGIIRLRSKRLNRLIIPRLSTTHNFTRSTHPIYRFLCDLQYQGLQAGLQFDWRHIEPEGTFFPRLVYKQIILQRATWYLKSHQIKHCVGLKKTAEFQQWWRERRLPGCFVLVEGDNELYIDIHNDLSILVFQDEIKAHSSIRIEEWLEPDDQAVVNSKGQTMANQWVATLYNDCPVPNLNDALDRVGVQDKRMFIPGSEWVYVKIYAGFRTQDCLLETVVWPLVQALLQVEFIDKWFFVRYTDPKPHLRIRFHLRLTCHYGSLLQMIYERLNEFQLSNASVTVQLDTYIRELERYAFGTIDDTEWLFFQNSHTCVQQLCHIGFDPHQRWLHTLPLIDQMLNDFNLSTDERLSIVQAGFSAFSAEFEVDIALRKQLNQKYRSFRDDVYQCMELTIAPYVNQSIKEAYGRLTKEYASSRRDAYLQHHIHMTINRMLPDEQRQHELMIYFFLQQWYKTQLVREKV